MGRYTAPSDRDYDDAPWARPVPCATRGCDGICDTPILSAFCYDCRCAQVSAPRSTMNDTAPRPRSESAEKVAS
jgi:hypothetical protein